MKKRKILFSLLILILTVIISSCGNNILSNEKLSEENMKMHLENLTSFNGRKIGSEGNNNTVKYIEEYFNEIGLDSIKEEYTSGFDVITYDWKGKPVFNIIDETGNTIKSYEDGIDYKIRFDNIAIGGKFKGAIEHINTREQITKNEIKFTNQAVLLDYMDSEVTGSGFKGDRLDDRVFYSGAEVIIYPEHGDVSKLNTDLGNKNKWLVESGLIKLGVKEDIYTELLGYYEKGYNLDIDIPIVFEKARAENISGIIKGKKDSYENTIVIAAPIDGLGEDYDGKAYANASDSGISTSLLLELARYMIENNIKVDSDIVFLGLNATQTGYLGFDRFTREKLFKYDKTQIIYLDDLGNNSENELIIGSYVFGDMNYQNNKLTLNKMVNVAEEKDMKFTSDESYYNSKYMEFRQRGIITTILTYGESPVAKTLEDGIDNVNLNDVEKVGQLVLNYMDYYGNHNMTGEIKGVFSAIYLYLIIGVFLLIFKLFYISKNKDHKIAIYLKEKPIMTIYLIGLLLIFTIVLQTQNHITITKGIITENVTFDAKGFTDVIFGLILYTGMMTLLLIPSIGLTLALITILIGLKNKDTISEFLSLILSIIGSYIFVLLNLNRFYNYGFSAIFPEIFALKYSLHIGLALIASFVGFITYVLSKEKPETKNLQKIITFATIFIIFVLIFYSPYVTSKSLIELKNFNGTFKF